MRPAWLRRRVQSIGTARLCALTKRGSFRSRRDRSLSANPVFSTAGSIIAPPHRRKTRRSKSIGTVWHRARVNRALPENEAGLLFDRAMDDRCARSPLVLDREVLPSLASRPRPTRKRSNRDLFRVEAARFLVLPKKWQRVFLRCPPEFRSDYPVLAETARCRSPASVSTALVANVRPFQERTPERDRRSGHVPRLTNRMRVRCLQFAHQQGRFP